jgi:hypothetical protein
MGVKTAVAVGKSGCDVSVAVGVPITVPGLQALKIEVAAEPVSK